jgi:hypothetical protein
MKSSIFNLDRFKIIPDILDINIDDNEQRFRIPNGLTGLICLYNICEELKINSELNPISGHHYHIDMTNTYNLLTSDFINKNENWILSELDSWNYIGTYNKRSVQFTLNHNWMRFQECFKTAEIRIGNMTFNYEIIVKRLIHACSIIQKLNKQLVDNENIIYNKPNIKLLKDRIKLNNYNNSKLTYLTNQLLLINQNNKNIDIITDNDKKNIIKNRVVKICI